MKKFLLGAAMATGLSVGAAQAGNIFLTGHDTDLHYRGASSSAGLALAADFAFVRNGSVLPVLTFDGGTQLTNALTSLGISWVNVNPNTAGSITAAVFDAALYSAIAVASHENCGGCDNTSAGLAQIATFATQIGAFITAGGGLAGFTGADDLNAYAYVPTAASNAGGSPPANGYVETAAGIAYGLVAENGDPTHNFFGTPGVGGLSASYVVVEVNGPNNASLAIQGAVVSCDETNTCTVVTGIPEPVSMSLLGVGLFGLAALRRRQA